MSDDEQDPQTPEVQQDEVGRAAERAEELRRAADSPGNLTTAEQESRQHDGEWEADASGTIQHTTGGAEGHPDDDGR